MFTKAATAAARARLADEQREILHRRSAELAEQAGLLGPPDGDPVDLATLQREAGLLERLTETELRELKEIDLALRRLEAGVYGVCSSCGQAVCDERLEVLPTTTLCASCATEQ